MCSFHKLALLRVNQSVVATESAPSSLRPSGAIAGIVDQPMQNFQRTWELQCSAGSRAKGVISGVGKGLVGVFTKPIGGAAELVSQTGYGELRVAQILCWSFYSS